MHYNWSQSRQVSMSTRGVITVFQHHLNPERKYPSEASAGRWNQHAVQVDLMHGSTASCPRAIRFRRIGA